MRIRLVKEKVIQDFVAKHAISKSAFRTWLDVLKSADWTMPEDMKGTFPATDILGKGFKRTVFDIGGNKYRLICGYLSEERKSTFSFAGSVHTPNIPSFVIKEINIP